MTVHTLVATLIPRNCTGKQALHAVNIMQQAIDTIWRLHGNAMDAVIFPGDPPEPPDEPHNPDDDIPF